MVSTSRCCDGVKAIVVILGVLPTYLALLIRE